MSNSKAELIRKNRRLKMILGVIIAIFVLACAGYGYHRLMPECADNKGENGIDSMNVTSLVPNEDTAVKHDETSQGTQEKTQKNEEHEMVTSQKLTEKETRHDSIQVELAGQPQERKEEKVEVKISPINDSQNVQAEDKAANHGEASQVTQEKIQKIEEEKTQPDPIRAKLVRLQQKKEEKKGDVVPITVEDNTVENDSAVKEKATKDIEKQME